MFRNPDVDNAKHRAVIAVAVMVPLFTLFYAPGVLLIDNQVDGSDGWAELGFFVWTMIVYAVALLVIIPGFAFTLARWIDTKTRTWPPAQAAMVFGAVAGSVGALMAVPMLIIGTFGWLPLLMFVIAPGLAGFVTRIALEPVMRAAVLRWGAVILSGALGATMLVVALSVALTRMAF